MVHIGPTVGAYPTANDFIPEIMPSLTLFALSIVRLEQQ